jgi:hypothetical protein
MWWCEGAYTPSERAHWVTPPNRASTLMSGWHTVVPPWPSKNWCISYLGVDNG